LLLVTKQKVGVEGCHRSCGILVTMTDKLTNPHDAFFKQYLRQPAVAQDFLQQHLPVAISELLDLNQLRLEKDSFVDEKLRCCVISVVPR
jgi:hypothetical protein